MKKSRFREEQMVTILREADRRPVPEVAKQHGVSAQTIYSWRKHFGTLEPADVKRLRQLEQENGRLKKMVADRDLEIDVLKEITRKNGGRTCAPAAGRVCAPTRAVEPPGVRRGHPMSAQRTYRLWHQAGLHVPRRRPRRRVASRRARPLAPTAMNHVWAYDFVFDTCADGRSLKCLTVVDEFTRECLAIDVAGSIRSGRVIDVLGQLVSLHGAPRSLRSDTGPEFIATALLRWLQTAEIDTAFIDPGKPWQNGTDESFNGQFRNECLSLEWFRNRMEAKIGIERWRRHDNEERPHMSLGDLTPAEFKKQMGTTHGWLGESLTGVILQ